MPVVLAAIPLSLTTVRVMFSKNMGINADIINPTRYVWSAGLNTIKVEKESNSTVIITTTEQRSAEIYELTVM